MTSRILRKSNSDQLTLFILTILLVFGAVAIESRERNPTSLIALNCNNQNPSYRTLSTETQPLSFFNFFKPRFSHCSPLPRKCPY